ncbi:helix-turn-helix transcriptional regulator [Sphingobacteriaceae bacterium WQ 2009]|uniref:Helix-turn-helix transcriptional regulator n=1 Tax=Rhinopithecimicrobium faecis TaxID=2820698 RepID=A0A8T4HIA1_9SPHI|nr:helix-turn-helix transcriptional regulator [Sphingobacteriaceae bacterium WQ 2009]
MEKTKIELSEQCHMSMKAISDVQDLMGGKWKYLIISSLYFLDKMRFMDLKRQIGTIAPKVLSKELKDLEVNHLIIRTVCNTKPITVEYELTTLGRSLHKIITAMAEWGIDYRSTVLK